MDVNEVVKKDEVVIRTKGITFYQLIFIIIVILILWITVSMWSRCALQVFSWCGLDCDSVGTSLLLAVMMTLVLMVAIVMIQNHGVSDPVSGMKMMQAIKSAGVKES